MNKMLIFALSVLCSTFLFILFLPGELYAVPLMLSFIIGIVVGIFFYRKPTDKRRVLIYIAFGMLFSSAVITVWVGNVTKPIEALASETGNVVLTVNEKPTVGDGYTAFDATVNSIGGEKRNFSVRVSVKEELDLSIGDRLSVFGAFALPDESQRNYDLSHGIWLRFRIREVDRIETPERIPIRLLPSYVSNRIKEEFDKTLSKDSAALISALLLGNREGLTPKQTRELRQTGLSHVVAVSGLHISFLTGIIMQLFRKRLGMIISVPVLIFFAVMTGATPSVLRAVIMQLVWIFSFPLKRETDTFTSMSVAAVCIVCLNPYSVLDVGLWLSFGAVAGITLWATPLTNRMFGPFEKLNFKPLAWLIKFVCASLATTITAQVFVLPISLLYFREMSFISPVANLLLLGVVQIAFVLSVILTAASFTLPYFVPILTFIIELISIFFNSAVNLLSKIPFGYASGDICLIAAVLGSYILVPLGICAFRIGRGDKELAVTVCSVLLSILWIVCIVTRVVIGLYTGYIVIPQMRGGQMVSVVSRDDCVVVNCGGYEDIYESVEELRLRNVRDIDLLIFTDYNSVSINRYKDLSEQMDIGRIILPYPNTDSNIASAEEIVKTAVSERTEVTMLSEIENEYTVGKINIKTFSANSDKSDNGRLLVYVTAGDTSLLTVGNVRDDTLSSMISTYNLSPDIAVLSTQFSKTPLADGTFDDDTTLIFSSYDAVEKAVWYKFSERENTYFPDYEKIIVEFTLG